MRSARYVLNKIKIHIPWLIVAVLTGGLLFGVLMGLRP